QVKAIVEPRLGYMHEIVKYLVIRDEMGRNVVLEDGDQYAYKACLARRDDVIKTPVNDKLPDKVPDKATDKVNIPHEAWKDAEVEYSNGDTRTHIRVVYVPVIARLRVSKARRITVRDDHG